MDDRDVPVILVLAILDEVEYVMIPCMAISEIGIRNTRISFVRIFLISSEICGSFFRKPATALIVSWTEDRIFIGRYQLSYILFLYLYYYFYN